MIDKSGHEGASMRSSAAPLACLALLPGTACAFHPLVTDDTGTQGAGGNQVEVAYDRTVDKAAGSRLVAHEVPLVFARGITDALDLCAGVGYQRIVPDAPGAVERGRGNPVLGAKWRFHEDEAAKLSFALRPEVAFAVSKGKEARGLGTARTSFGVALLATQETAFGAVHANLVAGRVNYADDELNRAERRTLYRLSVAPVWDVAEGWKLALDAGLMTNPDPGARATMGYVELGAIYSPGADLDLALGIVHHVADGAAIATSAMVAVTWRFR